MNISIETTMPSYQQLPDTFAIKLDAFAAITLHGEEQSKYLQGQVTCDVNTLDTQKLLTGAHCNAKGKVFSAFRLLNRNGAHWLLQPQASIEQSLSELKKFGVFAKVTIDEAKDSSFYAVVGCNAAALLTKQFGTVPDTLTPVIEINNATLVYIAGKIARYIVIDNQQNCQLQLSAFALKIYSHPVWNLLEICEGFPMLSAGTIGEYVPQMLNLQAINGISFTKGCYLGQETVARMQYLGKNKRALYALSGQAAACQTGDIIEKQLSENWRKAGDVLASYQADNDEVYLQGVLASDIETNTALQIKGKASTLTLKALPYSINTDHE